MYVRLILLFTYIITINTQTGSFPDCKSGPLSTFPICDQSLPSRVRAADVVSRMTTAEKITQLVTTAAAIPRLGLPKFEWWSEALHGVAYSPGVAFGGDLPAASSFPMPINLGATFNLSLVHRIASIISNEARAFNNEGRAGLVFFTPNINIFRDPRWGRGQETPGEDPFLTSQYVYTLINGLQRGDDERYLKIAADCKHYAAYDLEDWNGTDRYHFDARVSDQDLIETYMPPFETCIRDAKVASIMCSYNAVNGVPSCANKFILETIARESYHLDGFVVSDCGAVSTIMNAHHYTSTVEDTVAVALHAGTDLNCGDFYSKNTQTALDKKTIVEADIDQALQRTFNVLVRLGYFDPPEQQPYRKLSKADVDTEEARKLSLEAAQQSIVLLKNTNKALPFDINGLQNKKIALIGPTANATALMQGNYFGNAPFLISPLLGFELITQSHSINISYAMGCKITDSDESGFAAAIELAKSSDIVIFLGGIDQSVESEGHDRTSIALPDVQLRLIQQLEKVVRTPLHVVIMSGSSLDLSYISDSNECASLIWMGYAGQSGGLALANVMFGVYNPGGRLPITIYPESYVNAVSMFDMQMRPSSTNPGRTYKFYTGKAIFEFGDGLSYTTFDYSWSNDSLVSKFSVESLMKNNYNEKNVVGHPYRVNITNTGMVAGDDVVLAYVIPPQKTFNDQTPPLKKLFGFERVHLNVHESTEVFFPFNMQSLLTVAHDGSKWLEPGFYRILIGKQHIHTIHLQGKPTRWS
ncbi:unnamed protein product [Adineta steineri]|uniref:Fibronectin type III-like domain-containing protein n=1 Tax=Adineta steineri TaxID=433720 RepID=A0A818QVH3_9BILA|nr:unnamed protein product [Adineta steineri]CAF3642689.1 unnamed protein product [Adineta steineri]